MASKQLGETKGPIFLELLILSLIISVLLLTHGSRNGSIAQDLTSFVLGQLINFGLSYGIWMAAFVGFIAVWEKRRSLRDILFSIGFKKEGVGKSVFWALLILIPVGLTFVVVTLLFSSLLGPTSITQASNPNAKSLPTWYIIYIIVYAFFPVAVFEEAFGRGYVLDRLMPQHPSSIRKALPAILLSAILFMVFHVPSDILAYSFSALWAIVLLVGNVLPNSIFLGISYVRSKTRNVSGPILAHFLMDSLPYITLLIGI